MEDSPILLLFLIIYLIAASSGSRKRSKQKKVPYRAQERRSPMRAKAQGEQLDWRSILRSEQARQGFEEAFAAHEQRSEACENQPIHLHEVQQAQMTLAAEGEDPCHAGGRTAGAEQEDADAAAQDEARSALAQDILRGVIMSEILTRPHERAVQYAARRQKG